MVDPLLAPIKGAQVHDVAGVKVEAVRAGEARIKRIVYPAGFRWSTHMKPKVGTDLCMHAHIGFLARGRIHVEYANGTVFEFGAPQVICIEPGHDGWVIGEQEAVLIEIDFEGQTLEKLGMRPRSEQSMDRTGN